MTVTAHGTGEAPETPEVPPRDGFAKIDVPIVQAICSKPRWGANDVASRDGGANIVAIDGVPPTREADVDTGIGRIALTG
ncbi:MAG: hypothetical protein F4145_06630 [Boseongicola sp. SB0675_bin_26]|nr:hypothetical protein [Boseongicola sp. SB0675_bin_26]